ncbi:MAG: hypothetical protein AB8B96_18975 [Lysobacterales bacterium]
MRFQIRLIIALVLSAAGFHVSAQVAVGNAQSAPALAIAVVADSKDAGVSVQVSGQWNSTCLPTADAARIEDQRLVLVATADKDTGCISQSTALNLRFSVAEPDEPNPAAGVYPVSFYVRAPGQRNARLAGFDLIEIGSPALFTPEAGLWWSESGGEYETSGPGVGFALEVQDGEAVLMTNTYGESGASRWLLTTGSLNSRVIRGDLTELGGGQTLFGEFRHPDQARNEGRVLLEFHSSSRATLWLVDQYSGLSDEITDEAAGQFASDLIVQPVSLVRFSIRQQNLLAGTWMLLPEDGGQATRLELTEVESSRSSMTLLDSSGTTVSCNRLERRSLSPPQTCRLRGITDIRFTDIGLNRWRGEDSNGLRYLAVRLDP